MLKRVGIDDDIECARKGGFSFALTVFIRCQRGEWGEVVNG